MRIARIIAQFLLLGGLALGQSNALAPAVGSVACAKTISFAVAEGGQPVPAIPRFAAKWIGKKYHYEGHPELCLSQIPSSDTANYVVIFSTSESSFDGLTPSAHTYSLGPRSGNAAGGSSYGGTWNYAYSGTLPAASTSSIDLQKVDASKKVLVLRAYNQQGYQVSHYSVDGDHSREMLLEKVFADLIRDSFEIPSLKRLPAPLSVYYVNCDVDSPTPTSQMASAEPRPAQPDPKPTPPLPPQSRLDISSNPVGADVYLDGAYIGISPVTANVAPGEHIVLMRKPDFGTWQSKIQATAVPRRVTAYLERKFLTLPPGHQ